MLDLAGLMSRGCASSARVGIGLSGDALSSAREGLGSAGCRLSLVGFGDPNQLVMSLKDGKIDAAVRGALSSSAVLKELKQAFSMQDVLRVAVLEDYDGRPFLLAPVGIDEGSDMQSRLALVRETVRYFEPMGWSIRTGVLSKGRPEDASRGEEIRRSLDEGEQIAAEIRAEGGAASHYSILVEDAVKECDLILAPDGVSGNLIFRALHFVGGGRAYGAPVVNLGRVFVDTSRGKKDFVDSIILAAGLASLMHPSPVKA